MSLKPGDVIVVVRGDIYHGLHEGLVTTVKQIHEPFTNVYIDKANPGIAWQADRFVRLDDLLPIEKAIYGI